LVAAIRAEIVGVVHHGHEEVDGGDQRLRRVQRRRRDLAAATAAMRELGQARRIARGEVHGVFPPWRPAPRVKCTAAWPVPT
jgi:hypothetical protein